VDLPAPFAWDADQITVDLPGARALFSTVAAGNLGLLTGDPHAPERRARLAARLGVELAWRKQVHGSRVDIVATATDPDAPWIEADGLITSTPGVAPLVLAADCLPVILANGAAVAAVHAGWRGLAGGILPAAAALLTRFGGGPVGAAIGPGAGPCCYTVGDEVARTFAAYRATRGANLDLKAIAATQLRSAGVAEVHDVGLCTICADPRHFFSHRRDRGATGRQVGLGWLR
jgi:YfiH family protein